MSNGKSIRWVFLFGLWPRFVVFVLLLLFASLFPLTNTLRNLEDTHAVLQLTELLAGVFNDQQPSKILDLLVSVQEIFFSVQRRMASARSFNMFPSMLQMRLIN